MIHGALRDETALTEDEVECRQLSAQLHVLGLDDGGSRDSSACELHVDRECVRVVACGEVTARRREHAGGGMASIWDCAGRGVRLVCTALTEMQGDRMEDSVRYGCKRCRRGSVCICVSPYFRPLLLPQRTCHGPVFGLKP